MDYEKSQPQTGKTLFHIFARGGITIASLNIVAKIIALCGTLVLLKYITVYDYGLWKLLLSVLGIFALISLPGLDSVLITELGRAAGVKRWGLYRSILKKTTSIYAVLGVLAAGLLFLASPFIARITGIGVSSYLSLLSIGIISSSLLRVYGIAFAGKMKFGYSQMISLVNSTAYLSVLLLFGYFSDLTLHGVILSYVAASLITLVVFSPLFLTEMFSLRNYAHEPFHFIQTIRQNGKWGIAIDYIDEATGFLKPWIIGYFLGVEAVGILSAAVAILSALVNILPVNQILASVLPREFSDVNKIAFIASRSFKYSVWLYALLACAGVVAVHQLIPRILPHYTEAIFIFDVILLSLVGMALSGVASQVLVAFRMQKQILVSNLIPRFLSVALFLPLFLSVGGLYGAAGDHILSTYLIAWLRVRATKNSLPPSWLRSGELLTIDEYDRTLALRIWSRRNSW